ncbi:MAG: hypothetical protein JXA68_07130 [Ignavibacteriales bacterium]|nr:hypothetical protein [Ignavibacteriales bacterium]
MINKTLVKGLGKKLDEMIDWVKITGKPLVGRVFEIVDNYIPNGLAYLNEKYGDKIPKQYVDEIEAAIKAFIDDNYQGVLDALPDALDQAIDIKFFDDDFEAVFIATNFNAIITAIRYYSQKKLEVL